VIFKMSSPSVSSQGLFYAGLGMAAIGIGGQIATRQLPRASQAIQQTLKTVMQTAWSNSKYYKGGFEPKMSKREASLILGVSPNAPVN
jgi:DnaJ family protein C protein 19